MQSSLQKRFWSKVEIGNKDECWKWTATKKRGGYGHFSIDGIMHGAHRVSWWMHFGPIPIDKSVCHKCDNPECVNPNHLFIATHKENMQDMIRKGRSRHTRVHNCTKLSEQQVVEIRIRYARGNYRQAELAQEYSISKTQIGRIVRGEDWPLVDGPITHLGSGNRKR